MKHQKSFCSLLSLFIVLIGMVSVNAQPNIVMSKKWGEYGSKPGQFKFPTMIVADEESNIYVVDQHNHRIQKFDAEGNFILMWGKLGDQQGEFNYPYGIALDSKGNVYVSDMNNNRIQKFSSKGEYIFSVGFYGTADGQLKYPYGIAIDEKDVLYVIDAFNYRIQKFSTELKFLGKWGSQELIGVKLYMPHEIAITKEGHILLSDRQNHRISIFSKEGKLVKHFGEYGEGKDIKGGLLSEPHGIVVSKNGDIFITDRYNFRVQQFNANGTYKRHWLTSGIFDDSRYFPLGITLKDNEIYVVDHYAHCIQRYHNTL